MRVALAPLWTGALSLLLAYFVAAVYVSVINDLTDRADDGAANKRNRVAERSRAVVAFVLVVAISGGALFAWLWRDDVRLVACYAASWLAFAFYSFRPFRFKTRGIAGVLCDAAGAHLFPSLSGILVVTRGAQRAVEGVWEWSVAVWAVAYGLRGILWHQLSDLENDRAACVDTFARRQPRAAAHAGTFVIFPVEVCALAAMLWQIGSAWPPAFMVLYVLYAVRSARRWQTAPVIVTPKPRFFIVLQEWYSDLFPVALLIAATLRDRRDAAILVAHVVLFPRRLRHALGSISRRRERASIANVVVSDSDPHHGGLG